MERSITDFQYDCWLASACMPSGSVRKLLEHFGSPEACREAVQKHDESITYTKNPYFYNADSVKLSGTDFLSPQVPSGRMHK